MKPLKWPLVLFAIVGALLSACTSSTPVASQTRVVTTPLTPSPEFSCPATPPTSASGASQVLLIDQAPQDCFPTDAAKITAVALESNMLLIKGAAWSISLGYMPRPLFWSQTHRNGPDIFPMMRRATPVPRMWRDDCRSI